MALFKSPATDLLASTRESKIAPMYSGAASNQGTVNPFAGQMGVTIINADQGGGGLVNMPSQKPDNWTDPYGLPPGTSIPPGKYPGGNPPQDWIDQNTQDMPANTGPTPTGPAATGVPSPTITPNPLPPGAESVTPNVGGASTLPTPGVTPSDTSAPYTAQPTGANIPGVPGNAGAGAAPNIDHGPVEKLFNEETPGRAFTDANNKWWEIAGRAPGVTEEQTVAGQLKGLFENPAMQPLWDYAEGTAMQYANTIDEWAEIVS